MRYSEIAHSLTCRWCMVQAGANRLDRYSGGPHTDAAETFTAMIQAALNEGKA